MYEIHEKEKVEFSVLISIYDKEKPECLAECLSSIAYQTVLPAEVIIVEDGYIGDDLKSVIDHYKNNLNIKSLKLDCNYGLGLALNEGLNVCGHEIVARMDTDDIAVKDRFEKQISFLIDNPDIDIVGSWIAEFENDINQIFGVRKVPPTHDEIFNMSKRRSPTNHVTVMFKKSAIIKSGGYMHFPGLEDHHLWMRMLSAGKKFANISEVLVYVRTPNEFYSKRGGILYLLKNIRLQILFFQSRYITFSILVQNIFIRCVIFIMPPYGRKIIYKIMRKLL